MFDQLTESNTDQHETPGRRNYFFVTTLLVGALFLSGVVWSLYGKDIILGGDMELSVMVTPVAPPEDAPRPPRPQPERQQSASPEEHTTRQTNMLRTDEVLQVPLTISTTPNTTKARTNYFEIDLGPERTRGPEGPWRPQKPEGPEKTGQEPDPDTGGNNITAPPQTKKADPPENKKRDVRISTGVVNGKAIDLPMPVYSAAAKAIRAAGVVNVEVFIDEAGRVTSARAVSGHVMLRQSAERAAHGARFRPTLLSNEPVKVTGIIVYNFKL